MDLFIHELPKEKTKERVKVEVLSPALMWDNSKANGVFDLRAVEGQARRSGRGQPWPGSYRTYASV
jgi:hypothetical protein